MNVKIILIIILQLSISTIVFADVELFKHIEGKYPWEGSPSFFQIPHIKKAFDQLVPKKFKTAISTFVVGTPNRIIEDFFVVSSCKPHNCPGHNYIVIANTLTKDVYFIVYDYISGNDSQSTHCFSNKASVKDLPMHVKEEILLMHNVLINDKDSLYPKNMWIDDLTCSQNFINEKK